MARATTCPRCGSYVSQFAAGCAVCGADLERLRRRPKVRLRPSVGVPELGEGAALTFLMVAVAWFVPILGMALAALVFFDRQRRGHSMMRNVAGVVFLLAVIAFLIA